MSGLFIAADTASILPTLVRNELSKMPIEKQQYFVEEYNRKEKSLSTAYLLWFLLGWHYAYINKWPLQVLFWVTFGGFGIWWVIDAFRMKEIINDYNKDISISVIRDMKLISI
jgi:hypothetical protein